MVDRQPMANAAPKREEVPNSKSLVGVEHFETTIVRVAAIRDNSPVELPQVADVDLAQLPTRGSRQDRDRTDRRAMPCVAPPGVVVENVTAVPAHGRDVTVWATGDVHESSSGQCHGYLTFGRGTAEKLAKVNFVMKRNEVFSVRDRLTPMTPGSIGIDNLDALLHQRYDSAVDE